MKLILQQLLTKANEEVEKVEKEQEDDEVSFMYYGDAFTCYKMSKCKSSKCVCYLRGNNCNQECHNHSSSKSTNNYMCTFN